MGQAARSKRIALIVEDDPGQADLVGALFEEADYHVFEVKTIQEALEFLTEHAAETRLIFSDVWIDRSADGVTLAREVAKRWPWIKLIVTSVAEREGLAQLPVSVTYMQKPWCALDLLVEAERTGGRN
jgi:DNA-binding NtrC family response regulator